MIGLPLSFPLLLVVVSIIAAVSIGGCLGDAPAQDASIVRVIPPGEAFALIEENDETPGFVVIDVRRPDEFAAGHIPGAINIDSRHISERFADLDRNGTYVICCQRGGRSAGVRELMREAGFREVYEIEGGMNAWVVAGLPVTGE